MPAFHTIAIPHDDILQGRLTMEVFAADLWEVFKGRGAEEYRDPRLFFQKTYQTEGLSSLLDVIHRRLEANGGDPVIQIQTPFGGGKTHSLIAMYHQAGEWGVNRVVMVGTPMSARDTLWGQLEEQLTGQRQFFTDMTTPGRDSIVDLLSTYSPVLILIDELLEYVTKAAGVIVGESSLASQTIDFIQEITEAASTMSNISLVVTLPSSVIEHFDERSEQLFKQLQHVSGRVEKIYTPVQEHEITNVIRQRLFSGLEQRAMLRVIDEFMEYAAQEGLLPAGVEPSQYRKRFEASYPFLPEVIDLLYHRWGSFSTFQRTRGVLRLLALIIYSLKDSRLPYITLADFDLTDQQIRRELLKHIGPEFDSVIAMDISGQDSGSRKINASLGKAFQGLNIGTRVSTTVFMHSFSGGIERGATLSDIKRHATTLENPSSVVAEAAEQLKGRLFHIHRPADLYFFTNQINLTRVLLTRMENVEEAQIRQKEYELLGNRISKNPKLKVFIRPQNSSDIPESTELKLVILAEADQNTMKAIFEYKGASPRVHKNTLFFLAPLANERPAFDQAVSRYLAFLSLNSDKNMSLTKDQQKEVLDGLHDSKGDLDEAIRRLYRQLYIVGRDGFKLQDLGIPTYGESRPFDEEIFAKLRTDGEILANIVPLVIKERYLQGRDYVLTEQLYTASLNTPGENRVVERSAWEQGIAEGVRVGLFGLGELNGDKPICHYFIQSPSVALAGNEVIILAEICQQQKFEAEMSTNTSYTVVSDNTEIIEDKSQTSSDSPADEAVTTAIASTRSRLRLRFTLPKGKVSSLMGVMNLLQSRFNRMEVTLNVEHGQLTEQEYEDKIKEAFRQMGVDVRED
jgi:hypothetical protein